MRFLFEHLDDVALAYVTREGKKEKQIANKPSNFGYVTAALKRLKREGETWVVLEGLFHAALAVGVKPVRIT